MDLRLKTFGLTRPRVLDAPNLRDDFYCSTLAYSPTCHTLAVGLGNFLYTWSEPAGVTFLNGTHEMSVWLTSLAFSSSSGMKSILAFGRSDGSLGFTSMYETGVSRIVLQHVAPIASLSFRPTATIRPSQNPGNPGVPAKTEDLLVRDEDGVLSECWSFAFGPFT